jgi:hypothetical protein
VDEDLGLGAAIVLGAAFVLAKAGVLVEAWAEWRKPCAREAECLS